MKKIIPLLLFAISIITPTLFGQQVFKTNLNSDSKIESKKLSVKDIKRGNGVIVTSSQYDDIGSILSNIGFKYKSYQNDLDDAQMVFLNCGTSTVIPVEQLRSFVEKGGVLYASDLTNSTMEKAFKGVFNFSGKGKAGKVNATVTDSDISSILGNSLNIHFDLPGWAVLNSINQGEVLMESKGKPVMVSIPYGKGKIFYTCFHNHKQASDMEENLLKLLLTKQVQQLVQLSFGETAKEMGIDLNKMSQ